MGLRLENNKTMKALVGRCSGVTVAIPKQVMNSSGGTVARLVRANPGSRVLVLSDETSLPSGAWRHRCDGYIGGHNGIKSVAAAIGGKFERVQLGIGRPTSQVAAYVLGKMTQAECDALEMVAQELFVHIQSLLEQEIDAIDQEVWIAEGWTMEQRELVVANEHQKAKRTADIGREGDG